MEKEGLKVIGKLECDYLFGEKMVKSVLRFYEVIGLIENLVLFMFK